MANPTQWVTNNASEDAGLGSGTVLNCRARAASLGLGWTKGRSSGSKDTEDGYLCTNQKTKDLCIKIWGTQKAEATEFRSGLKPTEWYQTPCLPQVQKHGEAPAFIFNMKLITLETNIHLPLQNKEHTSELPVCWMISLLDDPDPILMSQSRALICPQCFPIRMEASRIKGFGSLLCRPLSLAHGLAQRNSLTSICWMKDHHRFFRVLPERSSEQTTTMRLAMHRMYYPTVQKTEGIKGLKRIKWLSRFCS